MQFTVDEVDKQTTVWGKYEAIQTVQNVQTHFAIYVVATMVCPVCGSAGWQYWSEVIKRDVVYIPAARQFLTAKYVRCSNCKVVYQRSGPVGYSTYPHTLKKDPRDSVMWESDELKDRNLGILLSRYQSRYPNKQDSPRLRFRLLDIGCSTGQFIEMALQQSIECEGIEIKPYDAEVARSRTEAKIHVGDFVDHQFELKYDVVNCTEVIEHILCPTQFVRKIREVLHPGGMLHLTAMPNSDSLRVRIKKAQNGMIRDVFSHFVLYNPSAMRFLLLDCGFRNIKFHAYPRRFTTFRNTLLGLVNRLGHWDNQVIVTAFKDITT